MDVLRTVEELRKWSRLNRKFSATVGLVPTMGALHDGHASLIRAAVESCARVAVTHLCEPHAVWSP